MSDVLLEYVKQGFAVGLAGFAWGTGVYLFAWMVRQGYALFRKITLSA